MIPPQALAAGGALVIAGYMLNRSSKDRLVKAFSGSLPPGMDDSAEVRLKRRPSWEAKFEGNEVPAEVDKALNDGARVRLQRRPSWSAKFEGNEVPTEFDRALNEGANSRLKKRPSYVAPIGLAQAPCSAPCLALNIIR